MRNKLLAMVFVPLLFLGLTSMQNQAKGQTVDFTYFGLCVGSPTSFYGSVTGITPVSWTWDFGDGTFANTQNATNTYAASNTSPGYQVRLTVVDNLGITRVATKFVSIQPLPNAFFSFTSPACSGDSVAFLDLSSTIFGNIERWVWNWGDGSDNDTVYFPSNPSLKHLFPTFNTYNVTLQVMNSDSCTNTFTMPVTLIPSPIANFYFSGRCEDQVVSFTDASSANGAGNIEYWDWNFNDPISGINNTSVNTNPTHTFELPGNYRVLLKVTNFNNCTDTISKLVTIRQKPDIDFTYTKTCLNELVYFDPDPAVTNIPAIPTWFWDFGDGITSTDRNAAHAYTTPGTYTVTLYVTDSAGCENSVSKIIEIHPRPVANFNSGVNNCAGAEVLFDELSTTYFGYIVRWIWNFGDGNQQTVYWPVGNPNVTHTYTNPGTYPVSLTIVTSDSCQDVENQNIIIRPNPVANFDFDSPSCAGLPIQFNDLSQLNGGGSITSFNWNFGEPASGAANTSTLQNPQHTYANPGTYQVILTVTNATDCSDSDTLDVVVTARPNVDFTWNSSCQNQAITFQPNAAVMPPATISTYSWDFGDGITSTAISPNHTYATFGNFQVTLTVTGTNGCSNSLTKTIAVVQQPIVVFNSSTPACKDATVDFFNFSNTSGDYINEWEWDFGDGSPAVTLTFPSTGNSSHIFAASGNFNVSLTVTTNAGCIQSLTQTVTIAPNPLSNFSWLTTCQGSPVQFNSEAQPGVGSVTAWNWNFADPGSGAGNISLVEDPTHTFNAAGTYNVQLIVTNTAGCSDTIAKPVIINPLPAVDFTFSIGCAEDSTSFDSPAYAGLLQSRTWDFGDGFTATDIEDPYHIYSAPGTYQVTLTVVDINDCENSITKTVTVTPKPTAFFEVSTITCALNPVYINDVSFTSGGSITSWFYDFGDGTDTLINAPGNPDIMHMYQTAGTYTIVLTITTSQGCEAEYTKTIVIAASPLAQFEFDNACQQQAVQFNDLTSPNGGSTLVSWNWNFGDPGSGANNISNLQNPEHVYSTAGVKTVLLLVTNGTGCTDTTSQQITIKPQPPIDFTFLNTCLGSSTQFTSVSTATISSYVWNFGDGTAVSTDPNPTHTYATVGNFVVTLSIEDQDGCENMITKTVSIKPQPNAVFSVSSACLGAATYFTDLSFTSSGEPITTWSWNFGDGTPLSTLQSPVHTYSTLGTYTVTLIATSASGCADTATSSVQVFGNPTSNYNYTAAPCGDGKVYFQDSSYNLQATVVEWRWEFDAFHYSTLQNPVYVFPASDSCYSVTLIVKDSRGCVDTSDVTKTVCVPADFEFTFASTATCLRDTTYFTPSILEPAGDSLIFFNWDFGDPTSGINNTSTLRNPSHYFSTASTYTVKLEAIDINNCTKTIFRTVKVNPLPVPAFTYVSGVCDSTITFNESSSGSGSPITRWVWNYGDGSPNDTILPPANPDMVHVYPANGLFPVVLTVTNANGCSEVITDTNVFVVPCIDAEAFNIDTLVCQNSMLSFTDSTRSALPIIRWDWDFGDGTTTSYTSAINPINHTFTSPGTFTVKMKVTTSVSGTEISDSAFVNVLVNATPIPDFKYDKICFKNEAKFTNLTSGNGTLIDKWAWTFGAPPNDTSSMKNGAYMYDAPGDYLVRLIATNTKKCQDTIEKTVTVYGLPSANYEYTLSCAGDKTTFTDLSTIAVAPLNKWNWVFSGNSGQLGYSEEQNPEFIFTTPGDFNVNLLVADTNGCIDTINQNVLTHSIPVSVFSYAENFNDIQGQLQFSNTSIDAIKYYWDFGNGDDSYAENPVVFYEKDGSYNISLVTWNSFDCTDTLIMKYEFMIKGLFVPTAFSPSNPKAELRLFKPVGVNLDEYFIEVYDRWGNLMWDSEEIDEAGRPVEGWDGTYNGKPVQQGVYVWKASAVFKDGSIWEAANVGNNKGMPLSKWGTVTLFR